MNWPNCWYGLDTEDMVGNCALSAGPFLRSQTYSMRILKSKINFQKLYTSILHACTSPHLTYMQAGFGKTRAGGAPGFGSALPPAAAGRSGCSTPSKSSKTPPEESCWLITCKTRLNHAQETRKTCRCIASMNACMQEWPQSSMVKATEFSSSVPFVVFFSLSLCQVLSRYIQLGWWGAWSASHAAWPMPKHDRS